MARGGSISANIFMVCCFLFRNLKLGIRSTVIAAAAGILGLTSKGSSLLVSYST